MKIISIVGTRPQFLKLIPLTIELDKHSNIEHIVIHSGQHYDDNMSSDLFTSLKIKLPKYILKRSGETIIQNLANMMIGIENIILVENPDIIIVYGDCDTTTAGTLVAKKQNIFLVHIEAGMRSYNKNMPEELNRVLSDGWADLLLCSTHDSIDKLSRENNKTPTVFVGNLQLDLLDMVCRDYNDNRILSDNDLSNGGYVLMTIHRASNTVPSVLNDIFQRVGGVGEKIIFPIHPRTRNVIISHNIEVPVNIVLINPVNYKDMTILQRYCKYIVTDSGGIQPEAYFLGKKCIVMRRETEWVDAINNGNNILYDYETPLSKFIESFLKVPRGKVHEKTSASHNIIKAIETSYGK